MLVEEPENAELHRLLGVALYQKGDLDGALAPYTKTLRINPMHRIANFSMGDALEEKGDTDGSIRFFRRQLETGLNLATSHHSLGRALSRKDCHGSALQERALDCYRTALLVNRFGSALNDSQELAGVHYDIGCALMYIGKNRQALTSFNAAITPHPQHEGAHLNLGNLCSFANDFDGAKAAFSALLVTNPQNAPAHLSMGNALNNLGDTSGAIAAYKRAIASNPLQLLTYYNLGVALCCVDSEGAIIAFKKEIELNSQCTRAFYSLGQLLQAKGGYNEALASYKPALKVGNGNVPSSQLNSFKMTCRDAIRQCLTHIVAHVKQPEKEKAENAAVKFTTNPKKDIQFEPGYTMVDAIASTTPW
jgi:tetratricopeptide (TPR) repeat protein